eukprot:CAMPEP_0179177986 /NCGR_PEP_ID=MMETSP0796-20121207/88034_1 /TAXON_ID=73915 /ORGANISM="Pyrodinium bahamense, Strain pbaha01" /LENGTH=55 /DNA_ID=CAMNT_0020881557 /DNA_START=123 /DNA_END=286 /DNA_ORIENTATION=-
MACTWAGVSPSNDAAVTAGVVAWSPSRAAAASPEGHDRAALAAQRAFDKRAVAPR